MNVIKLAIVAALIIPAGLVLAQSGDMKGMDMKGMDMSKCKDMIGNDMRNCKSMMGKDADQKSQGKSHQGVGVVKKIDPAGGTVTIAHGSIKTLKWPAMTMTFVVQDRMLLDKFAVDKKVEFEFVQRGSEYVITSAK